MRMDFVFSGGLNFAEMAKQFPEFSGRLLAAIGHKVAEDLYESELSGPQGRDRIMLHPASVGNGIPHSPSGKREVSYSIAKRRNLVTITSFPLNLWEEDVNWRGTVRRGKHILKRYRPSVASKAAMYAQEVQDRIFTKLMEEYGDKK